MNTEWQTFLSGQNPVDDQNIIAQAQAGLCVLDNLSIITFSGEDAESFLQGQLSNDVKQLSPSLAQYSSYNTPKGRMLAFGLLSVDDTHYSYLVPTEISESIGKRLKMYVLRSKVSVELDSDMAAFGVFGPQAESTLQTAGYTLPDQDFMRCESNGVAIIKLPDQHRYLLLGNTDSVRNCFEALVAQDLPVLSARAWTLRDIRAGIPQIVNTTQESFVPQMANLQHINGLSFTKGCYPGQEIVARTHYLGKLKKQMYHGLSESKLQPGDKLYLKDSDNAQSIGEIVSAVAVSEDHCEFLAVIQNEKVQAQLKSAASDANIKILDLPYSL